MHNNSLFHLCNNNFEQNVDFLIAIFKRKILGDFIIDIRVTQWAVKKTARQFTAGIVSDLERCFPDEVSKLCSLHDNLKKETPSPDLDFNHNSNVLKVSYKEILEEWKFLQRLDRHLSTPDNLGYFASV